MMNLLNYTFTKKAVKKLVITYYLQGYSIEEVYIKCDNKYSEEFINNIIDCYNYLNN